MHSDVVVHFLHMHCAVGVSLKAAMTIAPATTLFISLAILLIRTYIYEQVEDWFLPPI
jgi:hypothetical protein